MLFAERIADARRTARVTWTVAVLVGLAQVVAGVFPGTSRSAAAIFMAMLAGLSRRTLGGHRVRVPGGHPDHVRGQRLRLRRTCWMTRAARRLGALGLAFAAATVTGFASVRWLLGYIGKHRYTPFAIYRIALGVLLLLWLPAGE
jgi:undecaprenyl-diphosphatase